MASQRARGSVEMAADSVEKLSNEQFDSMFKEIDEKNTSEDMDGSSEESQISDLESEYDNTAHHETIAIQQSIMGQLSEKKKENRAKSPSPYGLNNDYTPKYTKNPNPNPNTKQSQSSKEEMTSLELETQKQIVVCHKFKYKPFGFSVCPAELGCNAIVTKVTTKEALGAGIKIGFVIAKIGAQIVLDMPHEMILSFINESSLPIPIAFADRGHEYTVTFVQKPLGFSIMKDENMRNGRVCRITSLYAQELGIKIDSYLVKVNAHDTWGKNHSQIIQLIKSQTLPLKCTFRASPKLNLVNNKKPSNSVQ